jgi:hypothetical protein
MVEEARRQQKEKKEAARRRREEQRRAEERRVREEAKRIRQELRVGMTMDELVELLGPPKRARSGAELLGTFRNVSIMTSDAAGAFSRLGGRRYCVWERPEGRYQLIVEGGKLVKIHSRPPR